ncbi:MAG: hypothetical protein PUC05_06975 [Firmicutes bacterium]|nr:hypothetical protein [Bacillota bacterium]
MKLKVHSFPSRCIAATKQSCIFADEGAAAVSPQMLCYYTIMSQNVQAICTSALPFQSRITPAAEYRAISIPHHTSG